VKRRDQNDRGQEAFPPAPASASAGLAAETIPEPQPGGCGPVGVILAGGASRRFGSPKALAEVAGRTMLQRVAAAQRAVLPTVIVVASNTGLAEGSDLLVIPDRVPGIGPLGGLHAGLRWAQEHGATGIVCAPVDAPLVTTTFFRRLLRRAEGATTAVPVTADGRVQPLFGWYTVDLVSRIEHAIREGGGSVRAFLAGLEAVRYLPTSALDVPDSVFHNVNRPEDLDCILTLLDLRDVDSS